MVSSSQTGAVDGPCRESKRSGTRLEDRIFFRDKTNTLKGPFTERQVQEWYRQKWFDSSFIFYFTQDNKRPSDVENGGITLEELRSLNGIGCPFSRVDGKGSELEKRSERLEKIEKEIAELKQKCAAVPGMEKLLEQVERKLEGLAASLNKTTPKPVEKAPKAEPVQKEEEDYDEHGSDFLFSVMDALEDSEKFGDIFAVFILDAFAECGTGDFMNWDIHRAREIEWAVNEGTNEEKVARNAVCERILVEKMKEKEFFCCHICETIMFNYKQALIHFTSREHTEKELTLLCGNPCLRVLTTVTDLPARLAAEDAKIEQERRKKYGIVNYDTGPDADLPPNTRPDWMFLVQLLLRSLGPLNTNVINYAEMHEHAANTMRILKGDIGRKAMAELHEHIGQAETWCPFCKVKTGDREGLYAHIVSASHMKNIEKGMIHRDVLTWLVNVHKKVCV